MERVARPTAGVIVAMVIATIAMTDVTAAGPTHDEKKRGTENTRGARGHHRVVKERDDLEVATLTRTGSGGQEPAFGFQSPSSLCGDDRDSIVIEYEERSIREPLCDELVANTSSRHFSFNEYNYNGYHSRAWITATLRRRMDQIRDAHKAPLVMSSGYRCPDKNNDVGGLPDSLHQFGRAADIDTALSGLSETDIEKLVRKGQDLGADVAVRNNHIHFEWE